MQTGISTASLFGRFHTEDGLEFLQKNNVQTTEVFLESYSEYTKEFGKLLKSVKGDMPVHSIHTLTTQFEPTLYSLNDRAMADSYKLLENTLQCAKEIDAKTIIVCDRGLLDDRAYVNEKEFNELFQFNIS